MSSIVIVYKDGYGKQVRMNEFRTQHKGGGGTSATPGDCEIADTAFAKSVSQAIITTAKGKVIVFPIEEIRELSRTAKGTKLINLKEGDYVKTVMVR